MRRAVYAGSFDPITNGHLWIIEQSAALFDSVVVAIGVNSSKEYTFCLNERLLCLQELTASYSNIEVTTVTNEFLVNYAKRISADYIIRGIRNTSDYEYERGMRYINSDLCAEINTIFLFPPRNYAEVSSSMVKGLIGSDGWEDIVQKYIPKLVFDRLFATYTKFIN